MDLKLGKPIAFFDLETTGINVATDKIIEVAVLKVNPDLTEESFFSRVNPLMHISKESTEITGISDEDVKDAPTFKDIAPRLAKFIENCDFGGFNSNRFDIPMLAEEFLRVEHDFDMKNRKCIDVQVIYHKKEPRTLSAAYLFYCGKDLNDAHSAMADTKATYAVLKAQLDHYPDLANDVNSLSEFSTQIQNADFSGRIAYNNLGEEIFNFGKHKGKRVADVFRVEPTYYSWMMNGDFPLYTKKVITSIYLKAKTEKHN